MILVGAVGVLPLVAAGLWTVQRAQETALDEVRTGNRRLAGQVARQLDAYVDTQVLLLKTLAAPLAPSVAASPEQAKHVLTNYIISFPHLHALDVVAAGPGCKEIATSRLDGVVRQRCGEPAVDAALAGKIYRGEVTLSDERKPIMTIAVPIDAAGERIGAVVAELDMVGIWDTVNGVRAGNTGYARLVTASGTLIAHGDPEERRQVFLRQQDPFASTIRAANPETGARYRDSQGREVIALAAPVADVGWTVIVEQPIAEAFRGANVMKRDLYAIVAGAAILAILAGLFIGGTPVRALEAMRLQANAVARGNLTVRVPLSRLSHMDELRQLALALNDMASELGRLHAEIRAKERLSTFARVAAGLAHDLQTPLESVRGACDLVLARPDEEAARDLLRSAAEVHLPRLHRYVRDLRRLAQDGKVPLELMSIDPLALAERVAKDAATSPKWQGVKFKAEGRASHIWADESLLMRAISNLVANGADACMGRPPPFGSVTISVHDSDGGDILAIAVTDTGVGIPSDRLADILVNDFRSNKRTSGVGLGLGVARHVAASHGGEIVAHSEAGKGSTFEIRIPRQSASGVDADPRLRGGIGHEQVG